MNKINIITYPDVLHGDALNIVLLYPNNKILKQLQDDFLKNCNEDVNLYLFDSTEYNSAELNYILQLCNSSAYTIIDIDNTIEFFRPILSFLISKSNTYWFTNSEESIYKHISTKHVYDLSFLPSLHKEVD